MWIQLVPPMMRKVVTMFLQGRPLTRDEKHFCLSILYLAYNESLHTIQIKPRIGYTS